MGDIISQANELLNELHLIDLLLKGSDMPKKYYEYFLLTIKDTSNYFESARAYSYGYAKNMEETFNFLDIMLNNIGSKLCYCRMCDFNKEKIILQQFNKLDKDSLDEGDGDSLVRDFVRKQQVYYPQLTNNENIEITEFKIIDEDKFNDLFK